MLPPEVKQISEQLKMVVSLLVNRQYEELDLITQGKLHPAERIMHWIVVDKVELSIPPEEAFEDIAIFGETEQEFVSLPGASSRAIQIYQQKTNQKRYGVDMDMWTKEDRSDYTLQLFLTGNVDGSWTIELEDLHVL